MSFKALRFVILGRFAIAFAQLDFCCFVNTFRDDSHLLRFFDVADFFENYNEFSSACVLVFANYLEVLSESFWAFSDENTPEESDNRLRKELVTHGHVVLLEDLEIQLAVLSCVLGRQRLKAESRSKIFDRVGRIEHEDHPDHGNVVEEAGRCLHGAHEFSDFVLDLRDRDHRLLDAAAAFKFVTKVLTEATKNRFKQDVSLDHAAVLVTLQVGHPSANQLLPRSAIGGVRVKADRVFTILRRFAVAGQLWATFILFLFVNRLYVRRVLFL